MPENLWTPAAVRGLLLERVRPLPPRAVPLQAAAGLVLAEPVVAATEMPRFTSSAMDGFALRAADTARAPVRLRILGRALAGRPFAGEVGPGAAVAIATGAAVPPEADAVVPVELVQLDGETVVVDRPVEPGQHIRAAGEDVAAGTLLLPAGTVLGPGSAPLAALLTELGAVAGVYPVVPDDPAALAEAVHASPCATASLARASASSPPSSMHPPVGPGRQEPARPPHL